MSQVCRDWKNTLYSSPEIWRFRGTRTSIYVDSLTRGLVKDRKFSSLSLDVPPFMLTPSLVQTINAHGIESFKIRLKGSTLTESEVIELQSSLSELKSIEDFKLHQSDSKVVVHDNMFSQLQLKSLKLKKSGTYCDLPTRSESIQREASILKKNGHHLKVLKCHPIYDIPAEGIALYCPNLTTLACSINDGTHLESILINCNHLTDLKIITGRALSHINYENLPELAILRLEITFLSQINTDLIPRCPKLKALTLQSNTSGQYSISHPVLQSLTIHAKRAERIENLDCKNLIQLEVSLSDANEAHPFINGLKKSSPLLHGINVTWKKAKSWSLKIDPGDWPHLHSLQLNMSVNSSFVLVLKHHGIQSLFLGAPTVSHLQLDAPHLFHMVLMHPRPVDMRQELVTPHLQFLRLSKIQSFPVEAPHLVQLALIEFYLSSSQVEKIAMLCPHLRILKMHSNNQPWDHLTMELPQLTTLEMTRFCLKAFSFPESHLIQDLTLSFIKTEEDVPSLDASLIPLLTNNPSISRIMFYNVPGIDDQLLTVLLRCPKISDVSITNAQLGRVFLSSPTLKVFELKESNLSRIDVATSMLGLLQLENCNLRNEDIHVRQSHPSLRIIVNHKTLSEWPIFPE
eukprot:TRINITY_DN8260_c0_g1_i1.p1 TRINITY_DN8260_c0_g1~~TRINITY_DN8260_c0_g1_i1.p1  ORF type:complete len:660 (-),score=140.68 TRINITY_DN8260_c0_g1_i1:55-1944(-)